MSQEDTDATTSIKEADSSSENTDFILMETIDDPPPAVENPTSEVSQTSSTSSEASLSNIGPEKDIKDESNKITDSPKRVKLIRPEFDKEKLAQKIREIEEREKLKLLNKLKEEELAKSEEKPAEDSSQNKTEDDKQHDNVAVDGAGKLKASETLDSKVVAESNTEMQIEEKSVANPLGGKSSKVEERLKEDGVSQQDQEPTMDTGAKFIEESKVSTSEGDSKLDAKPEMADKNIVCDSKAIPATTGLGLEKQKQDINLGTDDLNAKLVESAKKLESDDQVSSTGVAELNPSVLQKETKITEALKKDNVEQKFELKQQISVPKEQVEANIVKDADNSQIKAGINIADDSFIEKCGNDSLSKDVTDTHKPVGNIEKKLEEQKTTDSECKNTGLEKVTSEVIESGTCAASSSKAVDNEKKKEGAAKIGSEEKGESPSVTTGKIRKIAKENETESISRKEKQEEECSLTKSVTDGVQKSKIEKIREEIMESKSKVDFPKHVETVEKLDLAETSEKELKNKEEHSRKIDLGGNVEIVDSPNINVQNSIESVLDELTVEPSRSTEKKIENPGRFGMDTASKCQELSSIKLVDESSNKSEDILMEIEKFIDSSAEKAVGRLDGKDSEEKLKMTTLKTEEKSFDKLEAIERNVTDVKNMEKLASESKIVFSHLGSEKSATKRKSDDEVGNEDTKRKHSFEYAKSYENDNKEIHDSKNIDVGEEKLVIEKDSKNSDKSKQTPEFDLEAAEKENKEEIIVPTGGKDSDDIPSSKDSKDDNDETSPETPPLEKILDSIIGSETEPAEIPEEELVISDVPSTALVESKIPESPRRVKLVRPSKPATKTLTKPETTKQITQSKPVEQKLPSEINVETYVSVKAVEKSSTEKSYDIRDTKKADKEEAKALNISKPSDKPIEFENKLSVLNETDVKIDSVKAVEVVESSTEVKLPTKETTTLQLDEKLTTEKDISVKTQSFVESSIIKPQQTEKEISVVKTASEKQIPVKVIISGETSTVEAPQELKEKTAEFSKRTEQAYKSLSDKPNQPEETIISTKNLSKDFSERLPSQPKEKITGNESEQVDTAPSLNLKESSSVENPQSIQSIVPEKVVHSAVKSGDETVDKSFPEKPVAPTKITPTIATPNLSEVITPKPIPEPIRSEVATTKSFPSEVNTLKTTSSEEAIPKPVPSEVAAPKVTPEKFVKEAVVTKELKETLTAVSKVTEAVSPVKSNVSLSSPEKSPSTSGESETAKLRRIIRKPRHERMAANETKLAEGVTSSTALQSAKGDESKLVLSGAKEQTSENLDTGVKKVSQENIFLDMTVDEEDDDSSSKEGVVTNSEKKDIETKQLGFKLKIAKSSTTIIPKEDKSLSQSHTVAPILSEKLKPQKPTEHTFGSITISATTSISREKHQTDMRKVEEMLKDTDVTITPLVDRDPTQKLSKITLKIGKDGNPPEIKQMGESWSKQLDAKRKPSEPDDGGSPSRKKIKDESAVLTTSAGVEIDLHMTKPKLLSSMIAEPPLTTQDPRLMMTPQQMTGQTAQQTMGLTAQQMMSQLTPQQANIFLGTPQSQMFQGTPATPGGSEVVKKKRGRPRKIPLAEGQQPQDQKLQALKQQEMMHSQQGSSGTGTSSGSDEYSSGVFPQVPLFDMTESLFDQPHLFPNQVKPMRGRPQRSCRGRIKLPSVRTRKPRGSTVAARASTGRGRGRGYKRQFTESDNIITLENVKEEMRRQSLEQAQFMGPMEVSLAPHLPPEPAVTPGPSTGVIPAPGDHVQGAMKSPERKPRKRKNEEEERERIEKIKQRREEKKMKTLEKKRKIAEAKAKEKAAVMAAALVEEETRMSAPERKEEEKKKDAKTEKKIEGETDVSLVEEPSQPDSIRVEEPEEVSQQSLETKEPVQFAKELIEAHEPSTPVSKPDLIDVSTASCDGPIKVEPSSFQDIKKESSSTNTETVEPLFVTPKKEKKVYRCLICREDSPLKKLTSPLDHRSWRVLYQAAIVRGHEEIINLTKNLSDEIPTGILYHRNCRSEFTHKKTLAKLTDCPIPEDNQPIAVKTPGAENINPNTPKEVIMDGSITEYQWPLQGGELYMIQEQVSDFLEITSFKRKYPDIARRTVDPEERVYLRENGLVSEAHCDLGLIAVKSSDVLDIMFSDFQDKYEEFRKHIRDKQARELSMKNKAAFTSLLMDKRRFENRVLDAKTEAMQAVAAWNSRLNKTRGEQRRCMLDLQSMIVHYPRTVGVKRSQVPNPPSKVGHYPVALVPGQFCDNYKRYNPNELKYFPLNTVIYGPMKPNERHGGGSDGSQTDSDDSSSSDDSSDTSSESSQDSDASGDESNDKDMKERQPSGETHCKVCGGDKTRNKQDNPEVLINCAQCTKSMHPTCISLTVVMVPHIRRYDWQCTDCKTCIECKDPADEEKMLFCDLCDRGYHIYCVGLRKVPNGRWHCQVCSVCNSCGTTDPGGSDWQHEYKKEKNVKVYLQTLCGACDRQWRKGYYCQICLRCYAKKPEEEQNLIKCTACDRWMHSECCRSAGGGIIMGNSVLCELCQERAMPKNIHKNRERLGSY